MTDPENDRLIDLIYQRVERDYPFPPALQKRWDAALDAVVAADDNPDAEVRLDALVAEEPEMRTILQQRARKAAAVIALIDEGASYDPGTDSWTRRPVNGD